MTALVGGTTAINYDFDQAVESDFRLIAPVALLVIAIILAILLRALVAPLVLIASVILSFVATLGISILFIRYVVGDAGLDASIPTFAFIFLVSLGIDYTIFLMARVREEARRHGTREGMLRALSATGPVITSAGIILAGTFSVLMTLPVTFTFDLGFMVALGILLDTFIVRTIMVPAAVELLGDKIWWPSTARPAAPCARRPGSTPRSSPPGPRPSAPAVSGPSSGASLLGEGLDPLAEVLRGEAGPPQLDQLLLLRRGEPRVGVEGVDRVLVSLHRERGVGGDLGGELDRGALQLAVADHLVDEADPLGALG